MKLVESSTIGQAPRYIALSYCSGNPTEHHQIRTFRVNIDRHRVRIDFFSLPNTLRDAIDVARRLNISYLWVDALCIIQDDDDDKLTEIAAMHDIYSNAYLTVAACRTGGSSDGFLEPLQNPFFSAPMMRPDGAMLNALWNNRGVGLINSSRNVTMVDGGCYNIKNIEPLHKRGWTFQEALLSARVLYFSRFQPYWVCQKIAHAGGEPYSEEYFRALELQDLLLQNFQSKVGHSKAAPSALDFEYRSPWLAESYSTRVLSVLDDKIFAIHAIKELYRKEGGEYFAGMWLQNLAIDLLWGTARRHERTDT